MADLSYYHQTCQHPHVYKTLGQVLDETAKKSPNQDAIVEFVENRRFTYAELNDEVDRLAAGLRSLGFKKNDRIVIWGPNNAEWCISFFAAARAGLIAAPLNPLYQVAELEYSLNKIGAKGIILARNFRMINFYGILSTVCPELKSCEPGNLKSVKVSCLQHVITITEEQMPGAYRFSEVLELATNEALSALEKVKNDVQPEDPCNIQFTSGTTGLAKATVLSHYSILNNSVGVGSYFHGPNEKHTICAQVPLFHVFGTVGVIGLSIIYSSTVVIASPAYSPTKSLEAIEKEKCTFIFGTPTMFADITKIQNEKKFNVKSLKCCLLGGAATPTDLFHKIKETFNMKIIEAYGMTEVSGCVYVRLDAEKNDRLGPLMDSLEIKIVDHNNKVVPFGTSGELCIRGYNMLKYWADEEKTKEIMLEGGWLKTGDQFILYPDGQGTMVGRIKDMINRGGENVFPKEIEEYISQITGVIECTVFGIPDKRLGEEICVAVRLEDKATLTLTDIADYCKEKIASYKIPRYLKIMSDFPRTPAGKIVKAELQTIMIKYLNNDA